jgi:Uma2 family endonuclease
MIRAANSLPASWTLDDLVEHLGRIELRRIRMVPAPGTATEDDVVRLRRLEGRLYELVDGVLVEKVRGIHESILTSVLIRHLEAFAADHDLGVVTPPDGAVRLAAGLVRVPDVACFSWEQLPGRTTPAEPIPGLVPELAVEVLSESNTPGEMSRKLRDYFFAGTRLVWYVNPEKLIVDVYTAPDQSRRLKEARALEGGDVLPGFSLPLKALFGRVKRAKPKPPKKKGK